MAIGEIVYADECTCLATGPFPNGMAPLNYYDEKRAVWMFEKMAPLVTRNGKSFRARGSRELFWAVHFQGRHILNVTYK